MRGANVAMAAAGCDNVAARVALGGAGWLSGTFELHRCLIINCGERVDVGPSTVARRQETRGQPRNRRAYQGQRARPSSGSAAWNTEATLFGSPGGRTAAALKEATSRTGRYSNPAK